MLTVDKEKRCLLKDGKFFPYLADTAWTMIQFLNREEICFYLDKRKEQGFNAAQVCALPELDGINSANKEEKKPFFNNDVCRPDSDYFSIVQFVADECEKRDMVLVLLPTWGDKFNQKEGSGPEIFTPENAFIYGEYIASVIGNRENIIWMLGGDRPLETDLHRKIIDSMAEGLRKGEEVYHLITFHPCGEASSYDFLGDAPYLDFHSLQSSHDFGGYKSHKMILDILKNSEIPVFDSECFYEDFPLGFNTDWNYRLNPLDIRRRIYLNMMAGAFGHTYGHQSVWCFWEKPNEEYLFDWRTALDRPMANQMKNVNILLEKVDLENSKPSNAVKNMLSREGKNYIITYAPDEYPLFINLEGKCDVAFYSWFDPESGMLTEETEYRKQKLTVKCPFGHDGICLVRFQS